MITKQNLRELIMDISQELKDKSYMERVLYIWAFLFLKITSDTWDFKKKGYEEKYANHVERVERLMRNQPILLKQGWDAIKECMDDSEIGNVLCDYCNELDRNNSYLGGLFTKLNWNQLQNSILKNIIERLNKDFLAIENENQAQELKEVLDEILMDKQWLKERERIDPSVDFTPRIVGQLLTQLLEIKENEVIGDLVCGSGGLLIQVSNLIPGAKCQIVGQEKNEIIFQFCRLNMILHGIFDASIRQEDTLLKENSEEFDVVIANPPFSVANSIQKGGEKQYPYGVPPVSKADYAFIQKMLQSLKKEGRMATIISLGALSRTGAEKEIRKNMVKDNVVDAVILLPSNLFRNTLIKTCIMILKKDRERSDILFMDVSSKWEKGKFQNIIGEKDLEYILECYNTRQTKEGISYVATQDEVLANKGNLSVLRYVTEKKETEMMNLEQIRVKMKELEGEVKALQIKKKQYFKKLGEDLTLN